MRRVLRLTSGPDRTKDRSFRVEGERTEGGALRVRIDPRGDGSDLDGFRARPTPGGWTISRGGRTLEAGVTAGADGVVDVEVGGRTFRFATDRSRVGRGGPQGGSGPREVRSSMPGKVVRILRSEGDRVEAGDPVLVFEAMKMQNEIPAPEAGVIANMQVTTGKLIEAGEALFRLAPGELR